MGYSSEYDSHSSHNHDFGYPHHQPNWENPTTSHGFDTDYSEGNGLNRKTIIIIVICVIKAILIILGLIYLCKKCCGCCKSKKNSEKVELEEDEGN